MSDTFTANNPRDDGFFNPRKDEPHLPEDNDTPAAAPDVGRGKISDEDPRTDTDLDSHDVYDQGVSGAATNNPTQLRDDEEERDMIDA